MKKTFLLSGLMIGCLCISSLSANVNKEFDIVEFEQKLQAIDNAKHKSETLSPEMQLSNELQLKRRKNELVELESQGLRDRVNKVELKNEMSAINAKNKILKNTLRSVSFLRANSGYTMNGVKYRKISMQELTTSYERLIASYEKLTVNQAIITKFKRALTLDKAVYLNNDFQQLVKELVSSSRQNNMAYSSSSPQAIVGNATDDSIYVKKGDYVNGIKIVDVLDNGIKIGL